MDIKHPLDIFKIITILSGNFPLSSHNIIPADRRAELSALLRSVLVVLENDQMDPVALNALMEKIRGLSDSDWFM